MPWGFRPPLFIQGDAETPKKYANKAKIADNSELLARFLTILGGFLGVTIEFMNSYAVPGG